MFIIFCLFTFAPEDSNGHYLMDKQLAHYFPSWEARFDSTCGALRSSQGCLDLLNWYIDLDAKFEVKVSKILGLRYRNKYLGDYSFHISDHRFEPFFQLKENLRLLFTITTHYYKGEDETGIGFFLGKDYLNFIETFIIAEDFDRNFSLQNVPAGTDKIVYAQHPVKWYAHINKYWRAGHVSLKWDVSNRYRLQSTEVTSAPAPQFFEKGLHRYLYTRFWQDVKKARFGLIFDLKQDDLYRKDTVGILKDNSFEIIVEPMIAYRFSKKWFPHLYLTYNYKTEDDYRYLFSISSGYGYFYRRDIFAYLIDIEFHPGGNFVWHLGTQRQFFYNNQDSEFKERRINVGFEYRYKNIWFYFVEAMEGDFPTPKWMHNHTYVQLMLKF